MAEIEIPKPTINAESSLIRSPGGNSLGGSSGLANQKKSTKQLKGGLKQKELTFGEKLKRSFVKEDVKDIRDYVVFDVIIPSIRKSIFDTIVGAASQVFGISVPRGSFGYSSDNRYNGGGSRLTPHERQYRDYTSIQREGIGGYSGNQLVRYNRFYAEDYPFTYKEDADATLEQMMDICDTYGWVSVAKFFEIADPDGTITGKNPYTNNNYGWNDLNGVTVKFDGSGYVINFPPARPR